jgi:hypothetical protein
MSKSAAGESQHPLWSTWTDPEATLGGVVAAGSQCMCGAGAGAVLRSPRWGEWNVCRSCGTDQLAVLHGGDITETAQPDLVEAEALRCIQLKWMLSAI